MHKLIATTALTCALAGPATAQELPFAPGAEDRFSWNSFTSFSEAHDLSGESLEILGPWTGNDAALISSVVAYFAEATGADARYSGTGNFEQSVVVSLNAGTPPGVAAVAQPGLARDLAAKGLLTPLGQDTADWVRQNYSAGESWVDLASFAGPEGDQGLYGLFYKVDVKSLVWYSPRAFDEMGYDVPESLEELKELTEEIAEEGGTPWCIGLGSSDATGWPATDWVEDLMLRLHPPQDYDAWVANEMPFDDPKVLDAIEEYGWFARTEGFVAGGAQAAATTDFRDSPAGLFSVPNECYMHKQATFIPTFFPEGVEMGEDVDFFYFPASEERDLGRPVLGAGTMFVITEDSPAARAFIEFLKTPIAHEVWMAQSGFLTPFTEANPDAYASDMLREQGRILTDATTFRFDASDLMPGEIGTSAFWSAMIDYTVGASAEEAAGRVQERWDGLR
ncbi:ABC transporter substrate-binding protein [Roseivivax sp. GX 12232]|uniref:ABC transporter substrate-binding protein n=1 Tax=Roseivivax sp. GX 12232 TaxID=2900547 RepID=UPI001E3FFBFC|nr:ABC transporter substrate-binding protein [Roseivivax sp. GX 12232]MCE0506123.1 ABC transporter substrate-binding protein [Roseivivax sp. GX 12232]